MEEKARFRIKKGEIEIEYEGTSKDANSMYAEVLEWIKASTTVNSKSKSKTQKQIAKQDKEKTENKKGAKRGGRRSAVISPAIDELTNDGFFDDFKNVEQTYNELRRKTIPVSSLNAVNMALNRRVPKALDRIKDENGKWVYRKKS